jgi:hypothetical protein
MPVSKFYNKTASRFADPGWQIFGHESAAQMRY